MTKLQKIKNLIILLIIMIIISSFGFFHVLINSNIIKTLAKNYNLISTNNTLIVHFISVGQGDAIAINLPNDKVMLIDCGPVDANTNYTKYLEEKVMNSSNDKLIDYLVLTHSDEDHIGGAVRLLENFDVETIYMPVANEETDTYLKLLAYINGGNYNQIQIEDELQILEASYEINFWVSLLAEDENDLCPLISLEYMNKKFLFTGDISSDVEAEMIARLGEEIDCDVLKVAHHGSKYSSSFEFLVETSPQYSIISCGENSYGHPTNEAMKIILETGSELYRTDLHGNIVVAVGEELEFNLFTGNVKTTGFNLDIRILILVIDCVITFDAVVIFFKKEKKKRHAR